MKLFPSFSSLIDRLCVIAGAFMGSQIPEFMQQYTQRLAGHVDELQRLLNQMIQMAAYSNKTLEQYIYKFTSNSDPDFVHQGEFIQGIFSRWEELNRALLHLTQSSIVFRPYVFLKGLQYDIAQSTFTSFQPGINLSLEGLCYAGAGALMGWCFYQMISASISKGYTRVSTVFKQSV